MKRVIIESPYAATEKSSVARHEAYARMCMRHSLSLGEAPFASHLLYTQVLDDLHLAQRKQGIDAGFTWRDVCHYSAGYYDLGESRGMKAARESTCQRFIARYLQDGPPGFWAEFLADWPEGT